MCSDLISTILSGTGIFIAILTLIVSIITLVYAKSAISVANKIAFMQQWNSLITEYRSKEFGESIKAVTDFWIDEDACDRKVEEVESAYIRRVNQDKTKINAGELKTKDTLSFHRRTLLQFYWQLQLCLDAGVIDETTIRKYFNANEINLIAIVFEMAKVDADNCYRELTPVIGEFSIEKDGVTKSRDDKNESYKNSWQEPLRNLYERFKKIFHRK